jgi:hypothetical protein
MVVNITVLAVAAVTEGFDPCTVKVDTTDLVVVLTVVRATD